MDDKKAIMFFDDIREYFEIENNIFFYPIGEAFIKFIELDEMKESIEQGTDNLYFKLFKGKEDFKNNLEVIVDCITFYKQAAYLVLSSEIEEYAKIDTMTRYYLYTQYCDPEISEIKVNSCFKWVLLEGSKKPDESKIDFENGELCHETFEGLANSVKDCSFVVTEVYEINTIQEALHVSFIKMVMNNVVLKKCKCCEKYFIPKGRIDTEYCNRIAPNSTKTCSEVGAIKKYHEKNKSNPILQLFQKEYKKLNGRVRIKKITQNQFYEWSTKARLIRDEAVKSNMSVDEFKKLLDGIEI